MVVKSLYCEGFPRNPIPEVDMFVLQSNPCVREGLANIFLGRATESREVCESYLILIVLPKYLLSFQWRIQGLTLGCLVAVPVHQKISGGRRVDRSILFGIGRDRDGNVVNSERERRNGRIAGGASIFGAERAIRTTAVAVGRRFVGNTRTDKFGLEINLHQVKRDNCQGSSTCMFRHPLRRFRTQCHKRPS